MNRKEQQAELTFKLGLLLRPILDVIESPSSFNAMERSQIRARFQGDGERYKAEVKAYCHEADCFYSVEFALVGRAIQELIQAVSVGLVDSPETVAHRIHHLKPQILSGIGSVPVTIADAICEANTPFTTYCKIKTLCETTMHVLVYKDRYLSPIVFHRYLALVPDLVSITLVTWPRTKHRSKSNYDEFIDISRMYARENATRYRLLEHDDIHDRWLRCDNQLFHLGGSLKDAAGSSIYTLSKIEPTPANFQKLDSLLSSGKELFGPNTPQHA